MRRAVRGKPVAWVLAAVVLVMAVAAGVVFETSSRPEAGPALGVPPVPTVRVPGDECVAPMVERGVQCVGEVDQDPALIPAQFEMGSVLSGINQENHNATADPVGSPYVTVAYFLPLPTRPSSFSTQMRNELAGVALAQSRFNHNAATGDSPKIKVDVFNTGELQLDFSDILPQLDAQIGAGEHIVAATGFGQSVPATLLLIDYLSSRNILILPTRLTADVLSLQPAAPGSTPPAPAGLLRVAPSNSQLTAAAARELLRTGAQRVALFEDGNTNDPYNINLAATFQTAVQAHPDTSLAPPVSYNSSLNGEGTAFANNLPTLCRQYHPQAIYVAGRGVDIVRFLISLSASADCQGPITVLTADDGVDVLNQLRRALTHNPSLGPDGTPARKLDEVNDQLIEAFQSGKFVFRYTALTDPSLNPPDPSITGSLTPYAPDEGSSLLGYDAAAVAMTCIREAATQQTPVNPPRVVAQTCQSRHAQQPIAGVTGPLMFDASPGLGQGQALGRPIAVLEVKADGTAPIAGGQGDSAIYRPPYNH